LALASRDPCSPTLFEQQRAVRSRPARQFKQIAVLKLEEQMCPNAAPG